MINSYMNFAVDNNAVVLNMLDGEIKARMATRNNPEKKFLYKSQGIIDSNPAVTRFMKKHSKQIGNGKLVHADGSNFFEGIMQLSPLVETNGYNDMLKRRMMYEYDLSETEVDDMDEFLYDLKGLKDSDEMKTIISSTEEYKRSIENAWKRNESRVMHHIKGILGYEPEKKGKVSAYIMYPSFSTHRSCQISEGKTCMFFAKRGEKDPNKIIAYLAHQAVHQPMLPYKPTMTKIEKEEFHAFIKFLTDKEVYTYLTGKSGLDIVTQKENAELMGKVYPYYLGYRYRNSENPVEDIKNAIAKDRAYYDSLRENSRAKKMFEKYEFEKIDPKKVAKFFVERRGITPYDFVKIDFDDKSKVYGAKFVTSSKGDNEVR